MASEADAPAPMLGYVLIDKPVGPSSHTAVQQVRRTLGIAGKRGERAGHAGTLDPFASGLLLVLIGRATRLMSNVVGHDKRYRVSVRFGAGSDTDDATGTMVPAEASVRRPAEADVRAAAEQRRVARMQIPPAVSALHIDGQRAYKRVRRGEVIDVPARAVRFDAIDVIGWSEAQPGEVGPCVELDVRCATGTYMRALARDLGEDVGCPAHCEQLRRLQVGELDVRDAISADEVTRADVRNASELIDELPSMHVDAGAAAAIARGMRVPLPAELASASSIAVLDGGGGLIAIAEPTSDGTLLQPRTVLIDPAPSIV